MLNEKKFTVIRDGLRITGEIEHREERTNRNGVVLPELYMVRLKANRSLGDIEGYFEFRIQTPVFHFDTLEEAMEHLFLTKTALLNKGVRLEYEHDRYYVQDCHYHLWIDGITDEQEREHHEWLKEMESEDY